MKIQSRSSLKLYNTFGIKALAKYFVEIKNDYQLITLHSDKLFQSENKLILGGGSNILFTKDFDGIVVKIRTEGIEKIFEDDSVVQIKAKAGVDWDYLVEYCVKREYYGIENLSNIPGTVGAAPIQNIGAYGTELKDVIKQIDYFDLDLGDFKSIGAADCKFGYRDSIFKNELKNKTIITSIIIELSKKKVFNLSYRALKEKISKKREERLTIAELRDIIIQIRSSKLPDTKRFGSAGSFFKNPEVPLSKINQLQKEFSDLVFFKVEEDLFKIPAAYLIEKSGYRGKNVGNVGTYNKQALVIINLGKATGTEIQKFAENIQKSVFDKFGIQLNSEVNII